MDLVSEFLNLFDGYEFAYGQHNNLLESNSGKLEGRADTVSARISTAVVDNHLKGTGASLGIIPLKQNNKCKFGAIDIDKKHPTNPLLHSLKQMEEKINKLSLPLIICQSKSKGIHLYCFTQEEVDAKLLTMRLKEWASLIGYGSAEIFPKQNYRVNENDKGNWINLPYYDYSNTQRYAINKSKPLTFEQFIEFANVMRISKKELENFQIDNLDDSYADAPPCLQIIANYGIEEGSRNNGLYNFAVYFKNKYPDNWEDKIMEINGVIIKPSLNHKEVEGIIKSLNKKKYFYKCKEYPICQFCNKSECLKRKFGIGSTLDLELSLDNLTKYVTTDNTVFWYAEYQGIRIQLTTDELLNQRLLQRKLLNVVNKIFQPIKANLWLEKIEQLLTNCIVIQDPEDASRKGQFQEIFDNFLTNGVAGRDKRDLLKDSIYLDEKDNMMYFKSTNLFTYLKNKKFDVSNTQEIWHWLKDMGVNTTQLKIGNKKVRAWYIDAPEIYNEELDGDVKI